MLNRNQIYGQLGENVATNFLKKKKYKILENNYHTFFGEIDIIAKDGKTYVFVEVKTRKSRDVCEPHFAVNKTKQKHIKHSAESYLDSKKIYDVDIRFDIIEIVGENHNFEITHIIDAFN